ncbi:hypothetical protein R6Q57_026303 [Mikania cordata]
MYSGQIIESESVDTSINKLEKHGELLLAGIFDYFHDITSAFSPATMTDRLETTSRLAQWRIVSLASSSYRKSDPFKIGNWNW